jgi:hypothetical protein
MACNSCGSVNQEQFTSEIDIHIPGLSNARKSPVLVFPEILVCLNCGKAEFVIPKDELALLVKSDVTEGR